MAKPGKRSNGGEDYDSARAKQSKRGESSWQPSQVGDVPDSEEDVGHSLSVKFLTAAKGSGKTSHAVVSKLKSTVEEGKQKLAHVLEGKVLGVKKREYELQDTLIKTILYAQQEQTELHEKTFQHFSAAKPTASAVHGRTKSNIAASRELIGHYERVSQQAAFSKRVLMMESGWEEDKQTLQRILSKQRERTKLELHQLLHEDSKPLKEQVKGDMSKSDTDLWDHFAVGEAKRGFVEAVDRRKGHAWAVVAKNAQRGVRRAVKDLPEE